jgi:single-stranded DNA-binding protein
MNDIKIGGRLMKDGDLRVNKDGKAWLSLLVAAEMKLSSSERKKRQDEGKKTANPVPLYVQGKYAEIIARYMTKGKPITVSEGEVRSWFTDDGKIEMRLIAKQIEWFDNTTIDQTDDVDPASLGRDDDNIPF